MRSIRAFTLVAFAAAALLLPGILGVAQAATGNQTGPSGGSWMAFDKRSDAQTYCSANYPTILNYTTVVWVAGSQAGGTYYRPADSKAGQGSGSWGCFVQVVVAGFAPGSCSGTGDESVWVDPAKKTWSVSGSSGYKAGNGGLMCLSDALGLGLTQGLYKGTIHLLSRPELVKCAAPDQVVWFSNDRKSVLLLADLNAAKGNGGYVCLSLTTLDGWKVVPTGYAKSGDANCAAPDVVVWLNAPNLDFWPAGTPGYAAQGGQGVFMCKSDAVANLKYSDVSKIAGTKGSPLDSYPQASQPKCGPGEQVVWANLKNNGVVVPASDPNALAKYSTGLGGYICWSNAIAQAEGLSLECSDGIVYDDGKYAWPATSLTFQYYNTAAMRSDPVFNVRFMCASQAKALGFGPPPPGTPDSPGGPNLGSLTCFSGDKIEWILTANSQRVALGSSGAGQGDGAYLCGTASGDHLYAGTGSTAKLSGPKGSLLGFSAIPPSAVAYKICSQNTKYGDMFSYGVMGQYGWATDASPNQLFIYGDPKYAKSMPGHYACADDAVAAGWLTPQMIAATGGGSPGGSPSPSPSPAPVPTPKPVTQWTTTWVSSAGQVTCTARTNFSVQPGAGGGPVVWASDGSKKFYYVHDTRAGQGKGGYGCLGDVVHAGYAADFPNWWSTEAQATCPGDSIAWLNTMSNTYYPKGSKGYASGYGKFMCSLLAKDMYAPGT
jgi:hypothetical protein